MLIYQRSQSNWSLDTSNSALEETRELLREGENEIVVFESDGYDTPEVSFVDVPVLHG